VALPGPYLLTRTMWMECISDSVYADREELAADIVRVLREEIATCSTPVRRSCSSTSRCCPRSCSAAPKNKRSFMCGALSRNSGRNTSSPSRRTAQRCRGGLPRERIALHVCRGNWTPDESVALAGSYAPLIPTLAGMKVGAYLLEACTPRAGDMALLQQLPADARIGVGVVNQKTPPSSRSTRSRRASTRAIDLFGAERLLLHPDCGFATFRGQPDLLGRHRRSQRHHAA
jgi:5-methyltetrahydropteroyltriglutamate--homocysteine methyltransferase